MLDISKKIFLFFIVILFASCDPFIATIGLETTSVTYYGDLLIGDDEYFLYETYYESETTLSSFYMINDQFNFTLTSNGKNFDYSAYVPVAPELEYTSIGNYTAFLNGKESLRFTIKNCQNYYYRVVTNSESTEYYAHNYEDQIDLYFPNKTHESVTLIIYPYLNSFIKNSSFGSLSENIDIGFYGKALTIEIKGDK